MPAPISVIIPTLNAAGTIGPCLAAVALGLEYGAIAELIIADGGSTDDIDEVAEAVGANLALSPPGRGGQLKHAAVIAKADWLLFLHADTILAPDWPQAALSHIANSPSKAAYFKLRFDVTSLPAKTVARWANWRAKTFDMPYGDQALLISRKLYDQIGGYADIPLMEDVNIAKRLKGRISALNCVATTSATRYRKRGWLRQSLRNFSILMRYKLGTDPDVLAQKYRR